jgi:hypothetical protein
MANFRIWSNLLGWIKHAASFLRFHLLVTSRLIIDALSHVVWLIAKLFTCISFLIFALSLTIGRQIVGLAARLVVLVLLIVLVNFIKSLQPKYKFLSGGNGKRTPRHRVDRVRPRHDGAIQAQANETKIVLSAGDQPVGIREELSQLYSKLCKRRSHLNKSCAGSVTDANIQTIYKQLSWSSTRPEFECVYWINHTIQTLWPASRMLIDKMLNETYGRLKNQQNKTTTTKTRQRHKTHTKRRAKFALIKESDIQKSQPKLSIYLSCRRQLELLHKNKKRVLERGDEYLGLKAVMMMMYLTKRFILCLKQYIIDQICWLAQVMSSREAPTNLESARAKSKLIEIDINELLSRNNIKIKPNIRKVKSACETIKRTRAQKRRFRSAPERGLACNSKRIISSGRLASFDCFRKLRNKRQKLARSINECVLNSSAAYDKAHNIERPITVESIDFGDSAPEITAIKFLERQDDLLAEILVGNSNMMANNSNNTMRLIVELSFKSGRGFHICLRSVPILDQVNLTKFNFRMRVLVTINHMNFHEYENFAPPNNQLLPMFNQLQLSLIDTPQLDWHLSRSNRFAKSGALVQSRAGKRTKMGLDRRKRKANNANMASFIQTPRTLLKKKLHPLNVTNSNYFKYLVHAAIYYLQRWFQPFDIQIGEKFYVKTLC